jgi:hypothetical protein
LKEAVRIEYKASQIMPICLPTVVKASMVFSICVGVCAAEIYVRIRALSLGTTG